MFRRSHPPYTDNNPHIADVETDMRYPATEEERK